MMMLAKAGSVSFYAVDWSHEYTPKKAFCETFRQLRGSEVMEL